MEASEITRAVRTILSHESPVVFGTVSEDLHGLLAVLESSGNAGVPHIASAIAACAGGSSSGPYWWLGAQELCKVLSNIKTPDCRAALLQVLRTGSRIVEFDYVKVTAAEGLGKSNDPSLVPELLNIMKEANAPITAINKAIERLGGSASESPDVIITKGRETEDPAMAIEYFKTHESKVAA